MIYLLIAIIVLLSLTIVVLSINFRKAQLSHNVKLEALQSAMLQLTIENQDKLAKLKLSDQFGISSRHAREKLDRELMTVQYSAIETLAKNNLIT